MKIAMETSSFFPHSGMIDGIGRYAQNIYEELSKINGLSINGYCLPTHLDEQKAKMNNQIILSGLSFKYELLYSLVFKSNYEHFFQEKDILFLPDFYRIPIIKDTPMIATIHDSIPLSHPQWVYSSKIHQLKNNSRLKYTAKLLKRVICISEFSANDVVKHFGIDENRIDIIYHGIDKIFFKTVNDESKKIILEKYGLISKKYILHVSTFQPRKNQLRILKAYEKLPKNIKKEYPLVIVGKKGWGCDDVIEKIKCMNNDNVIWLNNVIDNELYVLYQDSICFVYPSLYEGFGFPILEAMASKTPVITSNCGSMKEISGDGHAYLVNPYNCDEISMAMKELVENSSLRHNLIISGRKHAEKFTWENSAKKHIDAFRKTIY